MLPRREVGGDHLVPPSVQLRLAQPPEAAERLPACPGGDQEVLVAGVLGEGVGPHHQTLGIPGGVIRCQLQLQV